MRSYPCVIIGCRQDVVALVREGDRLTLKRAPEPEGVVCLHAAGPIGHIPASRGWVARLLDDGDTPEVTVTGFDTDQAGKLAQVEIAVAVPGDEKPAIRSIISELGDELRILAFVGAADGRLAPAERGVMEHFALARAKELGLAQDADEAAHAVRWARRHAPNMLDIAGIVKKLSRNRPEALAIVWEACAIVAEVDGHIAQEERQSMATLRSLFEQGMSAGKR